MELLTNPFTLGLGLGLLLALLLGVTAWWKRRSLVLDNRQLREHLYTQMTINAKGQQEAAKEMEELKKQCENLRITVASLKNKPSKAELHTLYLYDKAIHLMYEKAPGFAPAWETNLKDAEMELAKANTGLAAWFRKMIHPSLPPPGSTSGSGQIHLLNEQKKSTPEE